MASTEMRADMDINEFEKQAKPRAKRSQMDPWRTQIFKLKAKGYANYQIAEFLAANGVTVTPEAVRKFIKSREGKPDFPAAPAAHSASGVGSAGQGVATSPGAVKPLGGKPTPTDLKHSRNQEIDLDQFIDKKE